MYFLKIALFLFLSAASINCSGTQSGGEISEKTKLTKTVYSIQLGPHENYICSELSGHAVSAVNTLQLFYVEDLRDCTLEFANNMEKWAHTDHLDVIRNVHNYTEEQR